MVTTEYSKTQTGDVALETLNQLIALNCDSAYNSKDAEMSGYYAGRAAAYEMVREWLYSVDKEVAA